MNTQDDDSDSAMWRSYREASQQKRANNREQSAEYLRQHGIPFTTNNYGAHLIVEGHTCFIDFWPGTGKWHSRDGTKGFGVRNLVNHIKGTT